MILYKLHTFSLKNVQNLWGLGWFNKAQPTPVLQHLAWRLWTCISHHFCGFHCTLQWSALLQWVGWFGSVLLRHPPGFGLLWPKCYSELLDAENVGITLPGSCFHCFFSNNVDQSPIFWEIFGHLCPLGPGLIVYSLFAVRGVMIFGNQTRPDLLNNLHAPWMGDSAQPAVITIARRAAQ